MSADDYVAFIAEKTLGFPCYVSYRDFLKLTFQYKSDSHKIDWNRLPIEQKSDQELALLAMKEKRWKNIIWSDLPPSIQSAQYIIWAALYNNRMEWSEVLEPLRNNREFVVKCLQTNEKKRIRLCGVTFLQQSNQIQMSFALHFATTE